jgi:hypothetical protein
MSGSDDTNTPEDGDAYDPDPIDLQDAARGHLTPGDGSGSDYSVPYTQTISYVSTAN